MTNGSNPRMDPRAGALILGYLDMAIHAIPVSQTTLDGLKDIFAKDSLSVESVEVSETDRANGGIACFRLRSKQGGKIRLEVLKDKRFPPSEMVCIVSFDIGFSLRRSHDQLYRRVVKRLEDLQ